tara:strand:+ start:1564 stop:1992 length:429 start_codon:yes stop_codon:yes gene_type:complete
MKYPKLILFLYFLFASSLLLQGQTLRDYIDGAKVAVDVIKLNKGEKQEKDSNLMHSDSDCSNNYGSVCFENNMLASLEIQVYIKDSQSDTVSLIIPKTASDCSYNLPVNIYEYCIINQKSKAILRKGQLKLERCDDLQVKIN